MSQNKGIPLSTGTLSLEMGHILQTLILSAPCELQNMCLQKETPPQKLHVCHINNDLSSWYTSISNS